MLFSPFQFLLVRLKDKYDCRQGECNRSISIPTGAIKSPFDVVEGGNDDISIPTGAIKSWLHAVGATCC
jgi:hypothetical protein